MVFDSSPHLNENNNVLKVQPKLPPELECRIDESNYVNLNDITKCKAISNDYNHMRSGSCAQKSADALKNGTEKSAQTHINGDNKNGKLNNFYLQINSTAAIANGHSTSKPIMSIVNQKNLNNIAKNCLTSNSTNNNSGVTTHTNNNGGPAINPPNCNGINTNNSINCNGVPTECVIDTKTIPTNGIDYNQNGLPTVAAAHTQYDVIGGQNQVQYANRNGSLNNGLAPQSYVIHNGNGLLTNGNASIKEMPRADSNKGKN